MMKLEILSAIADETNAYDITTELTEYVSDIDEPLGRAAVKAVGRIALEVYDASHRLQSFCSLLVAPWQREETILFKINISCCTLPGCSIIHQYHKIACHGIRRFLPVAQNCGCVVHH